MPEDNRTDDVEKILADMKSIEDRKPGLIADLLRQREAAIKDFDEKLAKLGYHGNRQSAARRDREVTGEPDPAKLGRRLSEAALKRISDAQIKRWDAFRKNKQQA